MGELNWVGRRHGLKTPAKMPPGRELPEVPLQEECCKYGISGAPGPSGPGHWQSGGYFKLRLNSSSLTALPVGSDAQCQGAYLRERARLRCLVRSRAHPHSADVEVLPRRTLRLMRVLPPGFAGLPLLLA